MYQGSEAVVFGEVHPAVLRNFKVPGRVYAAEVQLEKILDLLPSHRCSGVCPNSAVDRDLAFVVDRDQEAGR